MTETGGARLKKAVHVARAKAGIASDVQLAQRARVSYDTLMNWYGGKTVPRGHELEKVAKATGTSLWVLQAAYEGRPADPPPLQDSIRELVGELSSLVGELQRDRTERAEAIEVRLRAVEAEVESLRGRPTGGGLPEQSARLG